MSACTIRPGTSPKWREPVQLDAGVRTSWGELVLNLAGMLGCSTWREFAERAAPYPGNAVADLAAAEGWSLDLPIVAPLPEHYRAPHRRTDVDYIIARARRIVPEFGMMAMTDDQVRRLVHGAHVRVRISEDADGTPGFIAAPAPCIGRHQYQLFLRDGLDAVTRRAVLLHETAHALGGHFGFGYQDCEPFQGGVRSLATYPVWEREADLFEAIGITTPAERSRPSGFILGLLRERVQYGTEGSDEWDDVRAPWVARTLAARVRRNSARNARRAA